MVRLIRVVQPEVVLGPGQSLRELDLVAHVPRVDGRVRGRRSERWVVVESVKGARLSRIARDLDHKVCAFRQLEEERKREKNGQFKMSLKRYHCRFLFPQSDPHPLNCLPHPALRQSVVIKRKQFRVIPTSPSSALPPPPRRRQQLMAPPFISIVETIY